MICGYPGIIYSLGVPYDPGKSTLAQDLTTVQSLWKQAQRQHPHIAGLNPAWVISQANLKKALTPGQQAYTTLQNTYQSDQQQMNQLRDGDYQQLSNTISSIKQGCP